MIKFEIEETRCKTKYMIQRVVVDEEGRGVLLADFHGSDPTLDARNASM